MYLTGITLSKGLTNYHRRQTFAKIAIDQIDSEPNLAKHMRIAALHGFFACIIHLPI